MKRLALQRTVSLAVFAAAGLMISTSAFAQAPKGPGTPGTVARVNGVTVPQSRIDMLMKQQTQRGAPDTPEMRARVRDELVSMEAVSQEAAKRGKLAIGDDELGEPT